MNPKHADQISLPLGFELDPPSASAPRREVPIGRRALRGLHQDEHPLQSSPRQVPPSLAQAAVSPAPRDRISQTMERRQRNLPGHPRAMADAALQIPNQPARGSGAVAPSKRDARGAAGWQGAIATAVSPALLTLRKVRDDPPGIQVQLAQHPQASGLPTSAKARNYSDPSTAHARSTGSVTADAPIVRTKDFARTDELIELLRPDSKGDDVKELQQRLGLAPQGTYGPKTSNAVKRYVVGDELDRVNAELETGVDFDSMFEYEGFSLDGYVPAIPSGRSGVTIGMGVDIGQFSKAEIKALGLSDGLTEKLLPYAGLRLSDATKKLGQLGGLVVSVGEARDITYAVKKKFTGDVAAKYDGSKAEGAPKFKDLSPAQQTVIFSRFFHQGINFLQYKSSEAWWTGVTNGKWPEVQSIMRNYPFASEDWYKARVGKEADLLGDLSMGSEKK